MEELRRGGEEACAVGFVPSDRILVLPVDRDGMRRKAASAAVDALFLLNPIPVWSLSRLEWGFARANNDIFALSKASWNSC